MPGATSEAVVDRGDELKDELKDELEDEAKDVEGKDEPKSGSEGKSKPEDEAKSKDPKAKDGDEGDDDDDDADKKQPRKDTRIPLARHKELLEKERAERAELEKRLKHYEHADEVEKSNSKLTEAEQRLEKLEKELAKFNADGDTERAAEKMREIRKLDREIITAQNDAKLAQAIAIATENARYNIALERVEEAYPQLNPDHADYDQELMRDVADLKVTYERQRGLTPTEALQRAVKKLVPAATKKQEAAAEVKPQVDAEEAAKAAKKDIAAERKKEAVEKALDAVKKTPPSTTAVGADSDKAGGTITAKDVLKMSQKDFAALPEDVLKKMRGDEL